MSKMTMPQMDAVRFQESDVIVFSSPYVGKQMTISNLGNGKENDGDFYNNWKSSDINGTPSKYVEAMNGYFGTSYSNVSDFLVGDTDIWTLVQRDLVESTDTPSGDVGYNGTWTWNGSAFTQ